MELLKVNLRNYYAIPMEQFQAKTFTIPELKGISAKTIGEHLKLYQGYVKFANQILASIEELSKDAEKNAYALGEIHRRFSFEYNGMRNHEYYFASLENGSAALTIDSLLRKAIEKQWGSADAFMARFKAIAMTRGIGWAMLYYDKKAGALVTAWVDEQHLGQLSGAAPILALDMWEHSFVADYQPSGKKQYVEDFFANLNWEKIELNFANAK